MLLICKLFQSRLRVGQLKLYGISPILFMSRRLWYLLCVCSTWQKPCSGNYVVGNAMSNSFTFPQSSRKRSLHFLQKCDHPCAWNITQASSLLWLLMRCSWIVESHSLIWVSWQKAISPGNFQHNVNFGVIWAGDVFIANLKQQVAKRIFWTPQFSQDWVFGFICRSKLLLS